jgi:hypothetical protein
MSYDANANLLSFWVGNTLAGTASHSGGCLPAGHAAFTFGRSSSRTYGRDESGAPIEYFFDDAFVFGRALTQDDVDHIYNGGAGLSDWTT